MNRDKGKGFGVDVACNWFFDADSLNL
jgi:hypothetical protein